jgi:hypothetical protein
MGAALPAPPVGWAVSPATAAGNVCVSVTVALGTAWEVAEGIAVAAGACSMTEPATVVGAARVAVAAGRLAAGCVAVGAGAGVSVGAFGSGVSVGRAERGGALGKTLTGPGVGVRVGTVGSLCPGAAHRSEAPDSPNDRIV